MKAEVLKKLQEARKAKSLQRMKAIAPIKVIAKKQVVINDFNFYEVQKEQKEQTPLQAAIKLYKQTIKVPVESKVDFDKVKKFAQSKDKRKKIVSMPVHKPVEKRIMISPAVIDDPPSKIIRHKAIYDNLPSPYGIASELHLYK